MIERENDKHEAKEKINFATILLQTLIRTSNTQLGINLKTRKLIILDCATGYKGEIDLKELNESVYKEK